MMYICIDEHQTRRCNVIY